MGVKKVTLEDRRQLETLADLYLVKLYGDQSKALDGWLTGSNYKHCWKYETEVGNIAGIVAVSDKPWKDYVKLSTLIVDEPYRGSRVGNALLDCAVEYAQATGKPELSVTVAEDVPESISFFMKNNFVLKTELQDKYRTGKKELVLVRKLI